MRLNKISADQIRQAYEFIAASPPFSDWNMRHSEDVKFGTTRRKNTAGWHDIADWHHRIRINPHYVKTIDELMQAVAHEMLHQHEEETEPPLATRAEHSTAFRLLAEQVCATYDWDLETFMGAAQ